MYRSSQHPKRNMLQHRTNKHGSTCLITLGILFCILSTFKISTWEISAQAAGIQKTDFFHFHRVSNNQIWIVWNFVLQVLISFHNWLNGPEWKTWQIWSIYHLQPWHLNAEWAVSNILTFSNFPIWIGWSVVHTSSCYYYKKTVMSAMSQGGKLDKSAAFLTLSPGTPMRIELSVTF